MERAPIKAYETPVSDSSRWERYTHRPDDIFVCTPAKCGTTWMQTIVVSLLFPDGDAPGAVTHIGPWIDALFEPVDEIVARLDAQDHRRLIKTHTPADGIPIFSTGRYVVVARDPRDVFMSWLNHIDHMRPDVLAGVIGIDVADMPPRLRPDDVHKFFAQWLTEADCLLNIATWWDLRAEDNVLIVHYSDMKADLEGEMRRVAAFLNIDVPEAAWSEVVARCTFEAMKARPDEIGDFDRLFQGGAETFLFKGVNGRWRDVLTEDDLAAYRARRDEVLPPPAAGWIEQGSIGAGSRPDKL